MSSDAGIRVHHDGGTAFELMLDGASEAIEAVGVNSKQNLVLLDPLEQLYRPRSPWHR